MITLKSTELARKHRQQGKCSQRCGSQAVEGKSRCKNCLERHAIQNAKWRNSYKRKIGGRGRPRKHNQTPEEIQELNEIKKRASLRVAAKIEALLIQPGLTKETVQLLNMALQAQVNGKMPTIPII